MADPIHLLIPFAAGSAPAARDALAALRLPRLQALLDRLQAAPAESVDEMAPEPPHERALARILGLDAGPGRTPWAAHQLRQGGGAPGLDAWAWITPCHWKVGMDQVLMQDPAALNLAEDHSRTLLAAMAPFSPKTALNCASMRPAAGWRAASCFADLTTASIDRVSGRDVARLDARVAPGAHAAPPAERDADAALHPPGQRRARRTGPGAGQFVLGQRRRRADRRCPGARRAARRWPPTCATPRCARTGPPGRRPGSSWTPAHCAALLAALERGQAGAAHAVRRTRMPDLRSRAAGPFPADFKAFLARSPASERLEIAMKIDSPRHPPARRLGAGAGRRAPAAGAPVRRARRAQRTDELDDGLARLLPPAGLKGAAEAAVLLADAIAARQAPLHRGRLRLRRRHRLRRRPARPAPARRAARRLHRARPRGRRLRPDAADRRSASRTAAPTC